jgi:hypothetical protein
MALARNNFSRPYYKAGFTGWFRGLFSEVVISHPGTVQGAFKTASVSSKATYAVVTGSFATASVSTKSKVGSVEGAFKTAAVSTQAKFLVKD